MSHNFNTIHTVILSLKVNYFTQKNSGITYSANKQIIFYVQVISIPLFKNHLEFYSISKDALNLTSNTSAI